MENKIWGKNRGKLKGNSWKMSAECGRVIFCSFLTCKHWLKVGFERGNDILGSRAVENKDFWELCLVEIDRFRKI
jgi:hypothetical protein